MDKSVDARHKAGMTKDREERTPAETRPLRSYGRRKGKRLSPRKERLLADLLPQLSPDIDARRTGGLARAVSGAGAGGVARDRLRLGRASCLAGRTRPGCRHDRLRALHQRRRRPARGHRGSRPQDRQRPCRRCPRRARLASRSLDRPRVHSVSRSVAEDAPDEAAAGVARAPERTCPGYAAGRPSFASPATTATMRPTHCSQ